MLIRPSKCLIYTGFIACGNKGSSLIWRKPAVLFVDAPKVGIYINDFTVAQSLDLNLIDLERLDLFEVLKLTLLQNPGSSKWQDSGIRV